MKARSGRKIFLLQGKAPAFTLMEVMITLTMVGFILLMIFGVLRLGLSAWERGESTREEFQRVRIASQLISRQVKSILAYKIKTQKAEGDYLAFEGKPRSLKFVSALSLKGSRPSGLVFALYEFQEEGKEKGRLLFFEKRVTNKDFLEERPPEEEGIPLFEGVADVRFEYYRAEDPEKNREAGWVEEWNAKEEKQLPKALRMNLVFPKGKGAKKGEESSIAILASLPSYRYDEIRTAPGRRVFAPTVR
jgi:general secretion pathway protein J